MTLARKGTRRITVGSVVYCWKVRGRPTYCQAMGWSPLTFVVEREQPSGSRLVVSLPCAHPSNWLGLPTRPVLPRTVAGAIVLGLGSGWQPSQRGPDFVMALEGSALMTSDSPTPE